PTQDAVVPRGAANCETSGLLVDSCKTDCIGWCEIAQYSFIVLMIKNRRQNTAVMELVGQPRLILAAQVQDPVVVRMVRRSKLRAAVGYGRACLCVISTGLRLQPLDGVGSRDEFYIIGPAAGEVCDILLPGQREQDVVRGNQFQVRRHLPILGF